MASSALSTNAPRSIKEMAVKNLLMRLVREDQGQDLIEYALLAAFIALACITAITGVGTQLNLTYGSIAAQVGAAS